jgi:hypothetical protein
MFVLLCVVVLLIVDAFCDAVQFPLVEDCAVDAPVQVPVAIEVLVGVLLQRPHEGGRRLVLQPFFCNIKLQCSITDNNSKSK